MVGAVVLAGASMQHYLNWSTMGHRVNRLIQHRAINFCKGHHVGVIGMVYLANPVCMDCLVEAYSRESDAYERYYALAAAQ